MSYEVKIEAFEGPLDLLLHLIHRLEIDIYDIPVAQITGQYMEHVRAMQVLELNEASEYLVMAATLLAIKSKMLLPVQAEFEDEDEYVNEHDPREELVARLLEYRKYKEATVPLRELETDRAAIFTKAPMNLSAFGVPEVTPEAELEANVYDMLGAFQKMLRRKQLKTPLSTRIARQEVSVKEQMNSMMAALKRHSGACAFSDLFPQGDRTVLVVSFLSLLELMKRQVIAVEQERNFMDLTVLLRKEEWEDDGELIG
ncbi:segregation/condensation protein A [Planococcus lenghuensis]|uniref:Segregation and condensation protein A n=1 Tax=Planococcus lenghuensis TaxID=2213202 RepID=A0A1Q2KZN6_9BACL|nr:segregation/condensation protein A [Planococcus lenghuensis]AQQ53659.1 segregation/condensation protein A [Planococcus lenghuensis]